MSLSGFFRYRSKGNYFAICIVNGLQLQNDKNFLNYNLADGNIFDQNFLYDDDEAKEFAPAITYLVTNGFTIKLIDPSPTKKDQWGKDINKIPTKNRARRDYTKEDIETLVKEGYSVIFSTRGADANGNLAAPHAILAYKDKLYDPQNKALWHAPHDLATYLSRQKTKDEGQFLLAFRI